MRQISRKPIYTVILATILVVYTTVLITSCALPTKEVKTSTGRVSGVIQNKEGSKKSKQTVEQRLDKLSIRLQKIEQALGLNEFDIIDSESQEIDQNRDVNAVESISESDITENILPPDNNNSADDIFPPESSTADGIMASKSDDIYQKDHTVSQTSSTTKPEVLYNKARSLLLSNKFKAAEKEFKTLTESYPNHPLAVNSYYWMGECRYSTKDYKGAIAIFKELIEKYPNGRKAPDALLKTAYSYLSIKDNKNGRDYLKKVIKQFPFTPAGEKAEQRLQSIK